MEAGGEIRQARPCRVSHKEVHVHSPTVLPEELH